MSVTKIAEPGCSWTPPPADAFQLRSANSEFIDEVFRSGTLRRRDGTPVPMDVYIPPDQGDLLYSLIRFLQPRLSVEIGLANGISALHVAQGLRDVGSGRHLAIDPFQASDWGDVGVVTLQRAELQDWVAVDPRPSHWALPDLEQRGFRVQFAFIDGSHLFDYVVSDFMAIDRLLDVGGCIAFDDSDWPAVERVLRFAVTNRDYRVFPSGVVIEPSPGRPRLASRAIKSLARRFRPLRRALRHDFLLPSHQLGIQGRCVVLQKQCVDHRDSQQRQLQEF